MHPKPENPFRGWVEARVYERQWVRMAQSIPMGPLARPALAKAPDRDALLDVSEIPFQLSSAGPTVFTSFGSNGHEHEAILHPTTTRDGIEFHPVVAEFSPRDREPWLEPIQEFVLFFGAWPDHYDDGRIVWRRQREDGELEEIARWMPLASDGRDGAYLELHREPLLVFLTTFGFDLIVYFNAFMRNAPGAVSGLVDEGRDALCSWEVRTADVGGGETTTVINAIWTVFAPPLDPEQPPWEATDHEPIGYPYAIDPSTGREILLTFRSEDDYLTPLFFKDTVLEKYYSDPAAFCVTNGQVLCKGSWHVEISRTGRGTLHAWLGDVAGLPHTVQQHWRLHAIVEEEGVPSDRLARDLYAQHVAAPDSTALGRVRSALDRCNAAALTCYGRPMYEAIDANQEQRIRVLRVPSNSSMSAFQEQLSSLAQLVVEHISTSLLDAANIPSGRDLRSLGRLALLVSQIEGITEQKGRERLAGLFTIQSLRSTIGAHRGGRDADRALQRAGIVKHRLQDGFVRLVDGACEALAAVAVCLEAKAKEKSPSSVAE